MTEGTFDPFTNHIQQSSCKTPVWSVFINFTNNFYKPDVAIDPITWIKGHVGNWWFICYQFINLKLVADKRTPIIYKNVLRIEYTGSQI